MATGTSSDFALTRNGVIESALRKIGALRRGSILNASQLADGVQALNLIIREEDARGTQQAKNLWALDEKTLKLQAKGFVYNVADDGLSAGIVDLVSVFYRDSSGDDVPMKILTTEQYEAISAKDDTGDPEKVYLKRNKDLERQLLYVWPALSSVATTSEVIGSDGENYRCMLAHTSAAINKPISGTSYRLFWEQAGTSGSAWITATAYTNGEVIRYVFKRPLYDFDAAEDNPDMPQGWGRYLTFRLAYDLSFEYSIAIEERVLIKGEYKDARNEIFPSTQPITDQIHNKALYY